jgi:uncharacterized protein YhaN
VNISALEIDGYGVWSGLKVRRFSDALNVVYGPNEAGKTTLLQFIRSMLYGFSSERRRYLPPLRGGRGGGWVEVAGPSGRFQVDRHDDANGRPGGEQITITAADGTRQGEHMIKVLLANIDEPIFNNVFAVGLREIQELATLSDTQAAELLYSLSAGLDRVSLVEVMRELEALRNRILDRDGGPCQVAQLLADREKLRQSIEGLQALPRRYTRLAAERVQLDQEVARLEEERNRSDYQARVIDLAVGLRERWTQRAVLESELAAIGPQTSVPPDAIPRLDALIARMKKHRERIGRLDRHRSELRREAAGLKVSDALARQAARIEALQEQVPWLTSLQGQAAELEKESAELQAGLAAEHERLGLGKPGDPDGMPAFSSKMLARLRSPGRAVRQCQERLQQAEREAASTSDSAQSASQQVEAALAARQERDLATAIDRAGNLVSQFRRRMQIDERLDQMSRYASELEEQGEKLLDRQLLPIWVVGGLGTVFVLGGATFLFGVISMIAGFFGAATGSFGLPLAIVGASGVAAGAIGKVMLERSNARRLDSGHKQLNMLQLQIQQAKDERDVLDAQLPRGGGPIASRLAAAEQDLASLEALVPMDTRRTAARQDSAAAAQKAALAGQDLRTARQGWRNSLSAAGLPKNFTPRQVREVARRCDRLQEMQRRLKQRREELQERRRERDLLVGRVAQLVTDCGVEVTATQPVEQLRQLAEVLARQQTQLARRETIRRQLRRLRRQRTGRKELQDRLNRRRRELLRECGAEDERELRRRAVEAGRADALRRDRDALEREITAAIGGHCPQEAIRQQLEAAAACSLEARRDETRARLAAIHKELRERTEKRGQLAEQMKSLAGDRQLANQQLDLAVLEKRLDDAVRRWQVLAATCRILQKIRAAYEHERQPETLQEASGYLDRLTQGRYRRVWTPLGENVLRVDDAEGRALPVEVLSQGTREQLFLSLRLALAACYARRGAPLPLVLDDVLVNFDSERAKAAAAVLRDFAAAGHQLLVFTCHEHIHRLFQALKAPVATLPGNAEAHPAPITFEEAPQEKPKRPRKSPPAPRRPAKAPPPEPEEEEPIEDEEDVLDDQRGEASDEDAFTEADHDKESVEEPEEEDEEENLWEEDEDEQEFDDDADAA